MKLLSVERSPAQNISSSSLQVCSTSNSLMLPAGRNLCRLVTHCLTQHHASIQCATIPLAINCFCTNSQRNILINQTFGFHTSSMRCKRDYYEILGLKKGASAKDIKKAYYKLAKQYHPDVNKSKDANARFQEVSEAYEVLSDDQKRAQYDQFGADPFQQRHTAGATSYDTGGWQYQSTIDPEELFRKMFGGRSPFSDFASGFGDFADSADGFESSEQHILNISFEDAARGAQKSMNINVVDDCPACFGKGVQPGYKKVSCPYCNGTGYVTQQMGGFYMQSTCGRCRGTGSYNKNPCLQCEGHGRTVQRRTVTVNVPAGINDGETVRMPVGKSTVFITFKVAPSSRFRRDKYDIYCDVEISVAQAILGGTVKVPGIKEDTYIQIPPGTASHTKMRLTGKGIKKLNYAGHGDQYINIKVKVPKLLTEKQKALIQAWAELETDTPGTIQGISSTVEDIERKKAGNGATVVDDNDGRKRSQNGEKERYSKETFLKRLKTKFFG
ncbi:putative chaperone protein DnaJ [Onchocerca flexuosa]|uniref:Putative chaperone protein DnaJ n=1 Tax=Onchocerca flexuosa TaxID=387005 RepID=A0A238BY15_9BILA|nr:putative chaperone protein DnaJ [Onchocerca flexuosa]